MRYYHLNKPFVDFATLLLAFIFEGSMNAKFIDQCVRQPMRKVNQQDYIMMLLYHSIASASAFYYTWVKLLMKYQLPRSITREVRVLKPFPFLVDLGEGQLWYFNFFVLSRFLERTSSENSLLGWHLVIFRADQ